MNEWIIIVFMAGQMAVSPEVMPTKERCEEVVANSYLMFKKLNYNYKADMVCVRKEEWFAAVKAASK